MRLAAALEAEVAANIDEPTHQLDEHGRRMVVRNGRHAPREVFTSSGVMEVVAPLVNDKRTDVIEADDFDAAQTGRGYSRLSAGVLETERRGAQHVAVRPAAIHFPLTLTRIR